MTTRQWRWWAGEQPERQGTESTRREACRMLARALGRQSLRGMLTAEGGAEETYYYETREARDRDSDGAYAPAVYPVGPDEARP